MRYEDRLKDCADSHQSLRWKIVNYGYDMFIKTGVLTWVAPGTPLDWKNRMMKDGYWGDDVFLQLTSNILEIDLVIVPAFKETAVHQGLGFTLVTSFKKPSHGPLSVSLFRVRFCKSPLPEHPPKISRECFQDISGRESENY